MIRCVIEPFVCGAEAGTPVQQVKSAFTGLAIATLWRRHLQHHNLQLNSVKTKKGHFMTPQGWKALRLLVYAVVNHHLNFFVLMKAFGWGVADSSLANANTLALENVVGYLQGHGRRFAPSSWVVPTLSETLRRGRSIQQAIDAIDAIEEFSGGTIQTESSKLRKATHTHFRKDEPKPAPYR
jgi:hypothetical protein